MLRCKLLRSSSGLLSNPVCNFVPCRPYSSDSSKVPPENASTDAARPRTIFSGIQPSGVPHIGNYLGTMQKWVELQDNLAGLETKDTLIFSIVDLHALTTEQNAVRLRENKRLMMASLLAIGLDPEKCIIYHQSSVPEHTELSWILSTLAPLGQLNRMTQFKSKSNLPSKGEISSYANLNSVMLGLFAYPVLQAADILLYKTHLVPVGQDQAQHLELSRTLAESANKRMKTRFFPSPVTLLSQSAPRIRNLRDPTKKMSKSEADTMSRINITDEEAEIRKKISRALTDSQTGLTYDGIHRPGITNLLDIYAAFTGRSHDLNAVLNEFKDVSHGTFKQVVADAVNAGLMPIREHFKSLQVDTEQGQRRLDDFAASGAQKASTIAKETMKEVRQRFGLSQG